MYSFSLSIMIQKLKICQFTNPQVVSNLYGFLSSATQNKLSGRILDKQFIDPIDLVWTHLIISILQYILFCVQYRRKKFIQEWNNLSK